MNKITTFELPGYYSSKAAERIKQKLNGKSYMEFEIEYGGVAGNNTIIVMTEGDHTELELKEMFMYCAFNEI